jgi:hypothetical protein
MRLAFALAAFVVAGCGNGSSSCLPAMPAAAPCPAGIIVDASTTDPICLSASGLPLCRGNDAVCYICSGGDFNDNCLIEDKSADMTTECVHRCSLC